jgi:glutamate racemase
LSVDQPIGLFDSSLGGLTVYKEVKKILADENYVYFGDTGRSPYGSRPRSELEHFAKIVETDCRNKAGPQLRI